MNQTDKLIEKINSDKFISLSLLNPLCAINRKRN